jgi:hypothetical protein
MPGDEVSVVAVKLPTFWPEDVDTWFAQVEAEFTIRGVTQDSTKYSHVVAALTGEAARVTSRIIRNPPETGKYLEVKNFLCDLYGLSDSQRAEQLLSIQELGSRKPSELMSSILHLYGDHEHNFLIRHIFMRALPARLRQALATSKEEDLVKLAKEADRLVSVVEEDVARPAAMVEAAGRRDWQCQGGLCFYHARFGVRANRCRPPCNWRSGNERANSQ